MAKKPLCIAILWHMHQPDYSDARTREILLPWTRFHAVKDYYDMGALAAAHPDLHLTLNVVPALMDQLEAYARGSVREAYAELTRKDAAGLDEQEKAFLLRSFFQLPIHSMVLPFPRYRELLNRRGAADATGEFAAGLRHYKTRDYRDLQMWFNLSWCGGTLRREPEIAALFRKGAGFTEEDKLRLLEVHYEFIGRILPFYRRLVQEQGWELSVSPYYHAILPLLCDNRTVREALPEIAVPEAPFRFPEDAREQLRRARERFEAVFGFAPDGLWPSEGALSEEAVRLARGLSFVWMASDEEILRRSLRKAGRAGDPRAEERYSAHRWGDGPSLFFRDHGLSDLIGFTYSRWKPEQAAADFVARLHGIQDQLPDDGRYYVVPVILDGENAWEHYPDNAQGFLQSLYRSLTRDPRLRTVTFSEYLALESHRCELGAVASGSWIYGNLATWIGHPEKNRGWEFLAAARNFLAAQQGAQGSGKSWDLAYQQMMIAEGSDWFWWYGDDHQTANAAEFDALFRSRVRNIYQVLAQDYPRELDSPIKQGEGEVKLRLHPPKRTITPILDGRVSHYFEWLNAGHVVAGGGAGSMHRTGRCLDRVFFGFDREFFYLRLDLLPECGTSMQRPIRIQVHFTKPVDLSMTLFRDKNLTWCCRTRNLPDGGRHPSFAGDRILEMAVPLETLGLLKPAALLFFIQVQESGREFERLPPAGTLSVPVDPWELDQLEWIV